MSYLKIKWPPGIESINSFSIQTGILLGIGNAFYHWWFRLVWQVLRNCCSYQKFIWGVTCASHTVTFVTKETLKNVVKPQDTPYCKQCRHNPHTTTSDFLCILYALVCGTCPSCLLKRRTMQFLTFLGISMATHVIVCDLHVTSVCGLTKVLLSLHGAMRLK